MLIDNLNKFYIAVPKDTDVADLEYKNRCIFIFNDAETRDVFLKINKDVDTCLISGISQNNEMPFVISNKPVYLEHVVPQVLQLSDNDNIFIYENDKLLEDNTSLRIESFDKVNKKVSYSERLVEKKEIYEKIKNKYTSSKVEACPICGADKSIKVFNRHTYVGSEGHSKYYIFDEDIQQQLCKNCGLIYVNKLYPDKYYFEYYNSLYIIPFDGITNVSEYKSRLRLNFIEEYLGDKTVKKAIEVGSFDGQTTHDLKEKYGCSVIGLEPFENYAEGSVKVFPELKDSIINSTFEMSVDSLKESGKFDLALFTYSFRHIIDPAKAVENLSSLISENGLVLIDEYNFIDDVYACNSIYDAKLAFYQSKNYYYSLHHLIYLFEKFGFEFLSYKKNVENSSISSYTAVMFKYTGVCREDEERLEIAYLSSLNSFTASKLLITDNETEEIFKDISKTVAK